MVWNLKQLGVNSDDKIKAYLIQLKHIIVLSRHLSTADLTGAMLYLHCVPSVSKPYLPCSLPRRSPPEGHRCAVPMKGFTSNQIKESPVNAWLLMIYLNCLNCKTSTGCRSSNININ
ncbi:hypothetical protein ATANTOWER_000815 [Ataeniobius toweri]|uniref:Uncharacterized protein n=1 Tax=Ataeniobius toweri TaxID=208326 RepID=A0ABU7CEQ0_9TELE|nr:hypothetical protein [Ataeniobius toweri]